MEQGYKRRRRYVSASYIKSGTVYYGVLLFLVSQGLWLIQLFQNAAERKAAGQAPPENYTPLGIAFQAFLLLFIGALFLLLIRQRTGKTHMPRGNLYLLCNFLIFVWGVIFLISDIVDIFIYPEFILLVDALVIGSTLIAPPLILQFADRSRIDPDDMLLLILGIGGIGLSVISILIIAVILGKSYTVWHLVPELCFRGGCVLFGVSTLFKAIRIRNSLPISQPVSPDRPEYAVDMGTERIVIPKVTCPDCGRKVPVTMGVCPRCGRDVSDLPPDSE
jgi:hypothetical protein